MGGAGHKQAHNIFIWDRDGGTLIKVLEGPKEPLVTCDVSLDGVRNFSSLKDRLPRLRFGQQGKKVSQSLILS